MLTALSGPTWAQRERSKKHSKKESKLSYQDQITNSSLFIDATRERLLGDAKKAADLFEQCIQADPRNDAAHFELAQIYCEQNNWQLGKTFAEKALELSPGNSWYKQLLVVIYQNTDQLKDAIKLGKQAVKEDPENVDNLLQLASLYMANKDYTDAIKTLDNVEAVIGPTEEITMQKERIYLELGKTEKAVAEIQKLADAAADSDKTRYLAMIAEIYMQKKEIDKAFAIYKKIAEVDPGNKYIHISLADYYRQKGDAPNAFLELKKGFENPALDLETKLRVLFAYYSPQEIYTSQKDNVIELSQILAKTHPNDPQPHSLLGDLYMQGGQYADASKEFYLSLKSDSSKYVVWEGLLHCQASLENWPQLCSESQRVMDLFPLLPLPYLYNGISLMELKQTDQAIGILNKGVKLVFGNDLLVAQFYNTLGDAYNRAKQYKLSDESFDKALKLDSENSLALNNYAYYLSVRGENLDKAEKMAKKATELDPQNSANMDTYGWVLFKQGKYEQAKTWVEKAINVRKADDPELLEHYGDILFKLGNPDKALENWQKAYNAGGKNEQLLEKIREKKLLD